MSAEINEVLGVKTTGRPALVSAHARELLNLRRLPAMLNSAQTAVMLGLAEHDIPVLVRAGFLNPLGDPPPNAVKSFSTVAVLELAGESAVLGRMRKTVYKYWQSKNSGKAAPDHSRRANGRLMPKQN